MAKKTQAPEPSGPNMLQWGTLAGVVAVGLLAVNNYTQIKGLQQLQSRVASIDARVGKMQTDVAAAAARPAQQQQRQSGPNPNTAYTFKPAPAALVHGSESAPVTIVEVSDFQ